MDARIEQLTAKTLKGEMYVETVPTMFSREDYFLTESERNVKRICEYIENQQPLIVSQSCFTGFFHFDDSVIGDAFTRIGHPKYKEAFNLFYLKQIDCVSTMEWQHATGDYTRLLQKGMLGTIEDIRASRKVHTQREEQDFLDGLEKIAYSMIAWAEKCSRLAFKKAKEEKNTAYAANLYRLSAALLRVPANVPQSFYEAVLSIYVCFSLDPDSIGTLDRYLSSFYFADIAAGRLTREEAKAYLQELFLMLQAKERLESRNFTRGGQSHFCIGGYAASGKDCFNDLSHLIVESLMELPMYSPQITLRWTKQLPHEVMYFMMDCERKDPFKRLAFTNDDMRLKSYTEICHIPYERAVNYTTVGCNEPAFLGSYSGSNSKGNLARCIDILFHEKAEHILYADSYDAFYAVFEQELFSTLETICDYDNKYNLIRAQDISYVSCLVFNDCIENAKSFTRGGSDVAICSPMLMGITNVIDSLIVVKQFVFEEKRFTMQQLVDAVQSNWAGHEDMLTLIRNKGHFFGNDDDLSNGVAQQLYAAFYRCYKDKTNLYGYHFLVGDLLGYNPHHEWFGAVTRATPDGRHDGEMLKYCIGQSGGYDRSGLTALLNSVAKLDPYGISCGNTVTNITLDEALIRNDASFEKMVALLETFFKQGGIQFQLNYVSSEELLAAKEHPDAHQSLRVRVTGFSDYFVRLDESIQDSIVRRTKHDG